MPKIDSRRKSTDGWQGYERVLPPEVNHYISKILTRAPGAHQWYLAATDDGALASMTKQIQQTMGTNQGECAVIPHLL